MTNNHFLLLVSKKLSGEATLSELQELEILITTDPSLQQEYLLLHKFWEEHDHSNEGFVEDSLQKVLTQLDLKTEIAPVSFEPKEDRHGRTRKLAMRMSLAAATITALWLGASWWSASKSENTNRDLTNIEEKRNTKGVRSIIELSDGSKVWLNADSKIEYPRLFEGDTREIHLNGEAFFDVVKNPKKPFIIHLTNGTVNVLGTSFNVRAYSNEKIVETSVATGKVAFIPKYRNKNRKADTVFITPNNKVSYTLTEENIKLLPTEVVDDKAWTEGRLIFKARSLEDIAIELERNFGKKAVFLDDEARSYILTGSFQNNTLEEILYYLSLSKSRKIYYKITNNEFLIAVDSQKLQLNN
ncbi:MAG: FecR domain-containing protein [Chitinophagaceae bacterium]|nr:FecR domain-containing protein [Chitinophagaceae bacterium]